MTVHLKFSIKNKEQKKLRRKREKILDWTLISIMKMTKLSYSLFLAEEHDSC